MATVLLAPGEAAAELQLDLDPIAPGPLVGVGGVACGPHRLSALLGATWHHRWLHVDAPGALVVLPAWVPEIAGTTRHRGPRTDDAPVARARPQAPGRWPALTANLSRAAEERAVASAPGADRDRPALAALEREFLDGFFTPDAGDLAALAAWRARLGSLAGTGPDQLAESPELYVEAVRVLVRQLALVGADVLDDALVCELDLFARDLTASEARGLVRAGEVLGAVVGR
ncbi:MAG: hypothetical protein M0Z33_02295 [Actinomycetota bacterium]|nr:hypothetical protein [Actinomycetota bacterium]